MTISKIFSCLSVISVIIILFILNKQSNIDYVDKNYPYKIHKDIYIDRDFSETEKEFITSAALEWNEKTNGIIEFDIINMPTDNIIKPQTSLIVYKINSDYPEIIFLDQEQSSKILGLFHGHASIPCIFLVSDRLDNDTFKKVTLHELGHSLGLEHVFGNKGFNTLMYPNVNFEADEITNEDLKQFCLLYHCDITKLH